MGRGIEGGGESVGDSDGKHRQRDGRPPLEPEAFGNKTSFSPHAACALQLASSAHAGSTSPRGRLALPRPPLTLRPPAAGAPPGTRRSFNAQQPEHGGYPFPPPHTSLQSAQPPTPLPAIRLSQKYASTRTQTELVIGSWCKFEPCSNQYGASDLFLTLDRQKGSFMEPTNQVTIGMIR